jgi:hypothetical protein
MGRGMIWLLTLVFLIVAFLRIKSGWTSGGADIDEQPLLPKWLVRLISLGCIVFFQALEFHRYLVGLPCRPFFALYAAVIRAAVVWFGVRAHADINRQRRSRLRPQ